MDGSFSYLRQPRVRSHALGVGGVCLTTGSTAEVRCYAVATLYEKISIYNLLSVRPTQWNTRILCTAFVSINGDKFLRLSHHWKRNVSEMILNQGVIFTLPSFSSASKSKCSCWLTNLWLIASFGLGVTVTSLWMNRMWSISCSPQVKSDFAL